MPVSFQSEGYEVCQATERACTERLPRGCHAGPVRCPRKFMHGSCDHILGNMLFLAIFGKNVEDA
jgi:hypothetical protein